MNSLNPYRIEGQKTAAFEVIEQLGRAPDVLALPYGGGGNTCAYAKGFDEEGAQVRLVLGQAADRAHTVASAIRIAEPAHEHEVNALIDAHRVDIVAIKDEEITGAWARRLPAAEGSSSHRPPRGSQRACASSWLVPGSTVVCVLTGHGLKDTAAVDVLTAPTIVVEPTLEAIPRAGEPVTLWTTRRSSVTSPGTGTWP